MVFANLNNVGGVLGQKVFNNALAPNRFWKHDRSGACYHMVTTLSSSLAWTWYLSLMYHRTRLLLIDTCCRFGNFVKNLTVFRNMNSTFGWFQPTCYVIWLAWPVSKLTTWIAAEHQYGITKWTLNRESDPVWHRCFKRPALLLHLNVLMLRTRRLVKQYTKKGRPAFDIVCVLFSAL